ncbi:hypothetical protein LOAG_16090 [Loa loa]|uniref:Uncharacterized protein n=1 Tax=Loa loa TaxID=7209 RepID=A0A1S0TEN1_LOALO|nr:hypothetical protein LOAG_16090 [Loa loa]EFO12443.1 hypothetical protein LOAG_16090 [Loa loa]
MMKLMAYIAFVIYCAQRMQAVVAIITDGVTDKLWDDDQLIETMQLKSTLTNCGTMKDARLPDLEENPRLFVRNTLELIK